MRAVKLTQTQVAYLKNCRNGRGTLPTFPELIWQVRRAWVPAIPLAALGIWFVASSGDIIGWFMIMVAWGQMFASVVTARRVHSTMPVFQEIVDWDRVDKLIRENEGPAS